MTTRTVRILARLGVLAVASSLVALFTVQYVRIIDRNLAYARLLRNVEGDIAQLDARREQQRKEIRRLSDPQGAIPEIHDRLHLVFDHEEIIYLKRPHD